MQRALLIGGVVALLAGAAGANVEEARRKFEEAESREVVKSLADLKREVAELKAERDKLRAEVEALRRERTGLIAASVTPPTPVRTASATATATPRMPTRAQSAAKSATLGSSRVDLLGVRVGKVQLKSPMGTGQSERPAFQIAIRVRNLSDTQKLSYSSLAGKDISFARDYATLKDELGNEYRPVRYDSGLSEPVGRTASASVYPGEAILDLLTFEPPVDKATRFRLEIRGANVGAAGESAVIEFAAAEIER